MRFLSSVCVVLAVLLVGSEAFSLSWPKFGRCPDLSVQQVFQLQDYMGVWYTQNGYNLAMTQGKGRCAYANYTLDTEHNYVKVKNQQISASTNKWESISGIAEPVDPSKDEGKFTVNLYVWGFWKVTGPYWVLGTDYSTYSVVYGCDNFLFFFHYYSSWVLSRAQNMSPKAASSFYRRVNATLVKNNLDLSTFEAIDQSNCF
ncbi:apolipoprotein D-like isoform X2 [Macrosteles quadrilineatus]|uniref:apolipoprotein D-like isoform X2 n=1 Tax=Macrosteles quadrilineatus TaxID=74068 RepID=UPI0023E2C7CC|nr:apolipoprotein D-like isoform X2 [Macrosteles quadrilineatus]